MNSVDSAWFPAYPAAVFWKRWPEMFTCRVFLSSAFFRRRVCRMLYGLAMAAQDDDCVSRDRPFSHRRHRRQLSRYRSRRLASRSHIKLCSFTQPPPFLSRFRFTSAFLHFTGVLQWDRFTVVCTRKTAHCESKQEAQPPQRARATRCASKFVLCFASYKGFRLQK